MKVGVNYTPRTGWFHSWLDLDREAVRADLAAIAGLGLDHVRIFPLWPLLQPDRNMIRPAALDDVADVVAIAGEEGLDVYVDALNGHLSSFDYLPAWVTTWHRRHLLADPEVRQAQAELIGALAVRLRELPAAKGLSLGNEFGQFVSPRHPDVLPTTTADVTTWLEALFGAAQQAWPAGHHTHSYDDDLWFRDAHPFLPSHAVEHGASTTVHTWVFGKDWGELTGDLDAYAWLGRYLLELAAAWSGDAERDLWQQEIGAPSSHVSATQGPDFLRTSLARMADMPGLRAVTWWCSHDVSRQLRDFPELEHSLGLFDADGGLKPIGAAFGDMVDELRSAQPVQQQRRTLPLVASPDGSDRSRTAPNGDLFRTWLEHARIGQVLALTR